MRRPITRVLCIQCVSISIASGATIGDLDHQHTESQNTSSAEVSPDPCPAPSNQPWLRRG